MSGHEMQAQGEGPSAPSRRVEREGQTGENERGEESGSKAQQTELDWQTLFLQRMGVASETLSELASHRESFGLAWLGLFMMMKNKALGRIPINSPTKADLSETSGLSTQKIFFFLDTLPPSVEEIKFGSAAVKGRALPFLLRFLKRLQVARQEGREAPRLKAFTFGPNSIGPEELVKVLPLLLPSLESLCLQGNSLGIEGIRPLAECIERDLASGSSSLRRLDLGRTGLDREGLEILCGAVKAKGVRLEMLNLSYNELGGEEGEGEGEEEEGEEEDEEEEEEETETEEEEEEEEEEEDDEDEEEEEVGGEEEGVEQEKEAEGGEGAGEGEEGGEEDEDPPSDDEGLICMNFLFSALSLPDLRELLLHGCMLSDGAITRIAEVMGKGELPNLETLDLRWNRFKGLCLQSLGKAVKAAVVPCLKNLKLETNRVREKEHMRSFLSALASSECPPNLHVSLETSSVALDEQTLRGLGAGRYPCVRTLCLLFMNVDGAPFLREMIDAAEAPQFESLEFLLYWLTFEANEELIGEQLRLLGVAIEMERLACLESVSVCDLLGNTQGEAVREGKSVLFRALSVVKLPRLTKFSVRELSCTDADLELLAVAVRRGNLSGLRSLEISRTTRVGMEALMSAVVESSEGLPHLSYLRLNGGEGLPGLGRALLSRKFPNLSHLDVSCAGLTNADLRELADAVRGGALVGVRVLNLSENAGVDSDAWGDFMRAIVESEKGLPVLSHLLLFEIPGSVGCTDVVNAGGPFVAALASGKLPSLKEVDRRGESRVFFLDEGGLGVLCDGVRRGQFPREMCQIGFGLCIHSPPPMIDPLFRAIAESEKGLPPSIETLDLTRGRLGEEGLASFAASEGKLSHLKSLTLAECDINDNRLKRLGDAFAGCVCPNLKALHLGFNRVTSAGVAAFCEALTPRSSSLPKLENLRFNPLKAAEGEGTVWETLYCVVEFLRSPGSVAALIPT